MLLAIDIGNSNISFGLYKEKKLLATFKLNTDHNKTEDEYAISLITCLQLVDLDYHEINGVIVSSVVLAINPVFEKLSKKYFKLKPTFVGPNLKSGIKIKIDQPKSLGPDILVGIVAAYEKYGVNCLVIDLGTATTMSILNSNKEFIGGVICPGVKTSADSLSTTTSALPLLDLDIPSKVIGKDTNSCMQSGIMYGYASMLDGMINKMEIEYGAKLQVILTGGLAKIIAKMLCSDVILNQDLILDGLHHLFYKNNIK
ncbi:type III pantothenate kinase [Mycoplasma sp. P36-A1]|uniref:type III pantothenate kinase n=1 Tax=Mycoplasma sp. P36-A1 TaxID=3252900 RepID=UPI003C307FBF